MAEISKEQLNVSSEQLSEVVARAVADAAQEVRNRETGQADQIGRNVVLWSISYTTSN